MSSDNVILFSYTTPLTAGSTHLSDYLQLGQYISLSLLLKSDTSVSVTAEFSPNGVNNDYSLLKSFSAGVGGQESIVVQAKYLRFRILNTSGSNQTYIRFYVYGTPTNSVSVAQITKIGNFNPVVDVLGDGNWPLSPYGEPSMVKYKPLTSYTFESLVNGTFNSTYTSIYEKDYDLYSWSTNGAATISLSGGVARANNTGGLNETCYFAGRCIPNPSGSGLKARFTCLFNGSTVDQAMACGIGNMRQIANRPVYDFIGIGYSDTTGNTELEIIYIRNSTVQTVIPRSAWNQDPANGTVRLPNLDPTTLNTFEVTFGCYGESSITLSMVYNGRSYPIHILSYTSGSNRTNFYLNVFQNIAWTSASVATTPFYVGVGSCDMATLSPNRPLNAHLSSISVQGSVLAGTPTHVLSVRNPTGIFSGGPNYTVGVLYSIDISTYTAGTGTCRLQIFKNSTLNTPTFTSFDTLSPIEYDTVATIAAVNREVLNITLHGNDSKRVNLADTYSIYNYQVCLPSGTSSTTYTFRLSSTPAVDYTLNVSLGLI